MPFGTAREAVPTSVLVERVRDVPLADIHGLLLSPLLKIKALTWLPRPDEGAVTGLRASWPPNVSGG
jgi:hypothetical protein